MGSGRVELPHDEDVMNLSGGECHGPRDEGLVGVFNLGILCCEWRQQKVCSWIGLSLKAGLASREQTGWELMPLS